jgi:cobalt-precorrin 5A hydrolase
MKIAIICFSLTGWSTGERLAEGLQNQENAISGFFDGMQENQKIQVTLEGKSRYLPDSIPVSTVQWAGERFRDSDGIIFVGACGIAVRSIAPHIVGKKTDPAVLVIDECGNYVISLLSGHLGGANELALCAAQILGAVPVVTTATDLHSRFAVDVFAKKNGCRIFHMKAAKEASAALLAGEEIGFYSEFDQEGELPEGLIFCDRTGSPLTPQKQKPRVGVAVTIHQDCLPFAETVQVVPAVVYLGIGCKKGKEASAIFQAAEKCLETAGIFREALAGAASIDLKKEEGGILALSSEWGLPFETYTGEELLEAKGVFTPSSFVKSVTGVDNVCERSAVLAAGQGRLLVHKTADAGVTTAAAVKEWRICFE